MKFKMHKHGKDNLENFDKESLKLARTFAKKAYDEFGGFLKAVVLFGSSTKKEDPGDIDVLVVVDDISWDLGQEVAETYRIIIEKMVADVSTKLHITTLRLTSFWEYVRVGDPVGMNILRTGVALLDTGIFDPMKHLLMRGRIRPTPESVWNYFMKAPESINRSKGKLLGATIDLYWSVVDAAHSALMAMGEVPPSPEHVPDLLAKHAKKEKLIPKNAPQVAKNFYETMKKITHREVKEVRGQTYDRMLKDATMFVNKMREVAKKHELGAHGNK